MIKIPFDELGKMNFQQTVQKLANSQLKTPKAFAIKHLTKEVREGFFKMREMYMKEIQETYAVDGKDSPPAEGTKSMELKLPFNCKPGMEGDAKGALDAFGKRELVINRRKLEGALLFECNEWSPRELESLEFLVEEPSVS